MKKHSILQAYRIAQEKYGSAGINTDTALEKLKKKQLSLHCWQGDDVRGFDKYEQNISNGSIQATGNYPGKARNVIELQGDIEKALSLLPGKHRVNLHAIYGEFGSGKVDRDRISPKHFSSWIGWAKEQKLALDFNATLFSHPKAAHGFTLSSKNRPIRDFWVEHVKQCRNIAAFFGRKQKSPSIHNLWIPDGMKDSCVDRQGYRALLKESLDQIYKETYDMRYLKDALESKLFGIGSESFVVGSHEFYIGYALQKGLMLCLDLGHFHPTESVADKISSLLLFSKELLLHISRGIRWDSDHVVVYDDTVREIMQEIVRCHALNRVHIALDFFDASVNLVSAWVIGGRAVLKALLCALLEPTKIMVASENKGKYWERLLLLENLKTMPLGSIWDYYCYINDIPADQLLGKEIDSYERNVLSNRK